MAKIYSTQFFNGENDTDGAVLYTVPSGFVAVVRSIDVHHVPSAAGQVCGCVLGSTFVQLGVAAGTTSYNPPPWSGRQVLTAGQAMEGVFSGFYQQIAISGYLLSTP